MSTTLELKTHRVSSFGVWGGTDNRFLPREELKQALDFSIL